MELGIPYGQQGIVVKDEKAVLVITCPACGKQIDVPTDAVGEITQDTYGEHYVREHQ